MKHHHRSKRAFLAYTLLMGLGLLCVSNVVFATLIYDVNRTIGLGSVTGTIETDGTIGPITTLNIVNWSLTLHVPWTQPILTPANSAWAAVPDEAAAFTANIAGLFFAFDATSPESSGTLKLRSAPDPRWSGWYLTSRPWHYSGNEDLWINNVKTGSVTKDGIEMVAKRRTEMPEPASLALLSLGLAVLGFNRKYQRR